MNRLKELLLRHHARIKRVALFVLRAAIIPALLSVIYILGIGFTKLLFTLAGNPLYKKKPSGDSYWVIDETGAPDEEKYLRQS